MTISQEFGDRPLHSPGISGGSEVVVDEAERKAQKVAAELYRSAEIDALATRFQNGTASKEEEARLISMLSYEVGQGYN